MIGREYGTGSGSLSHSIINAILPNGHLYTFEFQKERFLNAKEILKENGFERNVSIEHRDIISDSFNVPVKVDSVILDLPNPWNAIKHAREALKNEAGANICIFCPCIEQVQRTTKELRANGFTCIETIECLERQMLVKETKIPILNLSCTKKRKNSSLDDENIFKLQKLNTIDSDDLKKEKTSFSVNQEFGEEKFKIFKSATSLTQVPGHTGYLIFSIKKL
ncbi:hypothetical protein MXB_2103 [Myxobolus squamalis]|nr:hypothetical protein MXB_2103 [Myxobolus squamalis]